MKVFSVLPIGLRLFGLSLALGLTLSLSLASTDAHAKRIGGGKSIGKQSQPVQNREAASREATSGNVTAATGAPQQSVAAARPQTAAAAAGAAAMQPRNRWLGPIAGLAAGLGLAALASHLGLGEELASFLMIMLAMMVVMFVVRRWLARRSAAAGDSRKIITPNFAYSGVGQEASVPNFQPLAAGSAARFEPNIVRPSGANLVDSNASRASWRIPADFDKETFLRQAREQYVRLQSAYDAADLTTLRNFATADMYQQLKAEIEGRAGASNRTDVVTLHAELLGIDSNTGEHTASVRFYGVIRELVEQPAQSFDEVWNLVKPVDGSAGWVLAGIQQLQ